MTEVQQIKHWHWPSAKLTWFPSDSGCRLPTPDLFAPYRVSLVDLALRRDAVVGPGGDRRYDLAALELECLGSRTRSSSCSPVRSRLGRRLGGRSACRRSTRNARAKAVREV